ncbi:MAG: thiol-disulfide isomerase-like thioredoxin [Verrucomicrobiales bacterium]|nr:thiol-disulfide isomerase-like thioredoxin [Verrucomicrobiales bacterium]
MNFPLIFSRVSLSLCFALVTFSLNAQSDQLPQGAEDSSPRRNDIDPAAHVVIQRMEKAYQNLKSARLGGHVEINLEFPGTSETNSQSFNSSFEAPNKFRHEITNGLTLGSDGDKGFVYDKKEKSYARFDFPMGKLLVENLPPLVPHILQVRNPSLLFAISKTPFTELSHNFDEVTKMPDVKVNGTNYNALRFGSGKESGQITMLVDQKTDLIRRFKVDFKPALEEAGKKHVNAAMLLVDYESVHPNASVVDGEFDWTPPEEAIDIHEAAGAARSENATTHLEGTMAPNFTLTSLDNKVVSLYELRGKVVVLDFWATWCPPCVASLPKFAALSKEEKDPGVQFFAINLQENRETIQDFLEKRKLALTVLRDQNGNTAKLFGVESIPQTIIIGKDGVVTKVFSGFSPDMEPEIQNAINDAKKAPKR